MKKWKIAVPIFAVLTVVLSLHHFDVIDLGGAFIALCWAWVLSGFATGYTLGINATGKPL